MVLDCQGKGPFHFAVCNSVKLCLNQIMPVEHSTISMSGVALTGLGALMVWVIEWHPSVLSESLCVSEDS